MQRATPLRAGANIPASSRGHACRPLGGGRAARARHSPAAESRDMHTSTSTHHSTSQFICRSSLLRLYRGPLLFSRALVSCPGDEGTRAAVSQRPAVTAPGDGPGRETRDAHAAKTAPGARGEPRAARRAHLRR